MNETNQCRKLLADNEKDRLNVDRDFRTNSVRMQARADLRREKELLLDQLEKLTGKREFSIDDIAVPVGGEFPGNSDDGNGGKREKVKV